MDALKRIALRDRLRSSSDVLAQEALMEIERLERQCKVMKDAFDSARRHITSADEEVGEIADMMEARLAEVAAG